MGASVRLKHGRPRVGWFFFSSSSSPTINLRPLVYHRVVHLIENRIGEGRLRRPVETWARCLGPLWDHMVCAMANDLPVSERLPPPQIPPNHPNRLPAIPS